MTKNKNPSVYMLYVPEAEIWRKFRQICIGEDVTLKEKICQLIEDEVNRKERLHESRAEAGTDS